MLTYGKRRTWLRLVFSLRESALSRIRYRLLSVFVLSVLLTFLQEEGNLYVPLDMQSLSLIGITLGIFLAFRNNTSYDRFWEGRKLWGQLVNVSRIFARDTLVFLRPDEREFARRQIYRVVAFVHALRMVLREQMDRAELTGLLEPEELTRIFRHKNIPNAILLEVGADLTRITERGALSDYRFVELTRRLAELTDIQGGCERIKNTPIPYSYSILTHQIVALYVFFLPFGLVQTLHFATPFLVLLVAYTFLGLDVVGEEIEDPFGEDPNDLPLRALSRMIEVNLRQTLGEEDVPPLLEPQGGVLL